MGDSKNAAGMNRAASNGEATDHWLVPVLIGLIGAFMSILDSSIVNVAIPTIISVFNVSTSDAQWVSTMYLLALGVIVPSSGWLADKLGLKNLYIASMAVFVFGSILCALSWSLNSLIVFRVVQAIGGGMIMPTTMSMVYRQVPKDKIGGAMGIFGIALLVAPALGPTLGGYLVEYVDWRWIFTINLPIGAIGILLSIFFLPEFSKAEAGDFDVGGGISSAVCLFCLLLALSKGRDWGWTSETTILLFYTSAVSLGLFIYLELTSKNPLLDIRLFKYTSFTMANLTIAVTVIGMYAGLFYIPLFLQSIRGLGAMQTGLLMMPGALVSGLMMPISGKLYDKVGPRVLVFCGVLAMAVMTYAFHNLSLDIAYSTVALWMVLRGMVMSFANMPAQTAALADIPTAMVGRASALTNIISRVSSSFGLAVLTSSLNDRMVFHAAHMAETVTVRNPAVVAFLAKVGGMFGTGSRGKAVAAAYIQGTITKVSYVQGIDDVFVLAAVVTLIGLVPAFFLKRGEKKGAVAAE
jgi:EmrB/QacA subfamily drug resistance transporter